MKLSISWIFDHIKGSWSDYNIDDLVKKINATTAEVEQVEHVVIPWEQFALARVIEVLEDGVIVESPEWKKKFTLPLRRCAQTGFCYLIKKDGNTCSWATLADLQSGTEGRIPPLHCTEDDLKGAWRKSAQPEDYVIEIGNVSITNRPDLWSHRGFAREIAAILKLELLPEEQFVVDLPVQHYETRTDTKAPVGIALETDICTRFAGISVTNVTPTHSFLWMVVRLARVEGRSIDALVDMTNYVLHDIGHPMHAFDAQKIADNKIIARQAHKGEKLLLLDDQEIELSPEDCVIADGKKPLSLAGIMGGKESSVEASTTELFLEAAHFNPTAIRLSSGRHKVRTESSVRFEKNLDPNANTFALLRYLKLLQESKIDHKAGEFIYSVGRLAQEKVVKVSHECITQTLGVAIASDQIVAILARLGFGVQVSDTQGVEYTITVPTYRGTKDIGIKEDIVEEVGRFFGYDSICPVLPERVMAVQDHSAVYCRRRYKQHCAFALQMHEVSNYALYDEIFLQRIGLHPEDAPALKNPVSEHWRRLVTSLVPHFIKNISQNCANESQLSFFEWNRIWKLESADKIKEWTASAGIFYDRTGNVDFYSSKAKLWSLFDMLDILVVWRKPSASSIQSRPWMDQHKQAELVVGSTVIGYAGMVAEPILHKVAEGKAFAFELDMDAIATAERIEHRYRETSKYQSVALDVSMMVPFSVTVADLEESIVGADARIHDLYLVDLFEKPEWGDKRSVTIRYIAQDPERTMTSEDIEELQKSVHQAVGKHGVQVR